MKIADHQITALQALGYTETEAHFLYVVATHSGYFVPRQYLALSGASWGYRTDHFLEKLESQGHVYWREYQGAVASIISSRSAFTRKSTKRPSAIAANIRLNSSRPGFFFSISSSLTRTHNYLETEQAKVAYFCEQLGLLKRSLPVKAYLELAIEKPPSDTSWTNTHCSSIPPMPLPPLWSPSLMWTPAMLGSLACQPLERLHSVVTIAASFSISLHREFRQPISREQRGAFPRSYGPLLEPTFQQSFCAIFDCAKGGR